MEKLKAFIQTMTFWNWLAVVLAPLALIGGLNAFFGLRSRWKDWRGLQSKKQFEKRVQELRTRLFMLEKFTDNPTTFFVWVLSDATTRMLEFVFAFGIFVIASLVGWLFSFFALVVIAGAVRELLKLNQLTNQMNFPELFGIEVVNFIKAASDKGLTSPESQELLTLTANSKIYTDVGRDVLFRFLSQRYPQAISTVFHSVNKT